MTTKPERSSWGSREPVAATVKSIANLKPEAKRYEVSVRDIQGLRVRVQPSGNKSFCWYWREGKATKCLTMGPFSEIQKGGYLTLKQAREKAELYVRRVKRKMPPMSAPRVEPEKKGGEEEDAPKQYKTVREIGELYFTTKIETNYVPKAQENVRRALDKDVYPVLGDIDADLVDTPMASAVVWGVMARGKPGQAKTVLDFMKQLFRFAKLMGLITVNPVIELRSTDFGIKSEPRERKLAPDEIKPLWDALDSPIHQMSPAFRAALKILALTGVRSNELRIAEWEHINWVKAEWTIPKANTKTRESFIVPLAPQVVALFKELKAVGEGSPRVLPGARSGPIGDKALGRAMRRLWDYKDPDGNMLMTIPKAGPHDFRRTINTLMRDELDIEPHIAEKVLNHSLGSNVEKHYNKSTLLKQRREAMARWADYIDLLVVERENVVRLRG